MPRRMTPPATDGLALQAYLKELGTIVNDLWNGRIDEEAYEESQDELIARYAGRVSTRDLYLFEDEASYVDFIRQQGFEMWQIGHVIDHERDHFEEAQRQGYNARYGMWACRGGQYMFMVKIAGDVDAEKKKEISLKPEKPSTLDRLVD